MKAPSLFARAAETRRCLQDHLPGKHDQSKHGRKGKPGKDSPDTPDTGGSETKSAGRRMDSGEARAMQDGMLDADPWTSKQREALGAYVAQGYIEMNGLLRGTPKVTEGLSKTAAKRVQREIRQVEAAMRPLPEPLQVSRLVKLDTFGITESGKAKAGLEKLLGGVWQEPGFLSTSTDDGVGRDWDTPAEVRIHIDVPEGTRAAYLGYPSFSPFAVRESEMLLAAGTKLKFVPPVTQVDGQWLLKAQVVA